MSIRRFHSNQRMSQIVVHEKTVYLAGQVASDAGADVRAQTRQVLEKIDSLLAEAGTDKGRLLSATIYLAAMTDFAAMNAVWEKWLPPGAAPARATVQVSLFTGAHRVEISIVAAV